jgi:hypothetical protein
LKKGPRPLFIWMAERARYLDDIFLVGYIYDSA